MSKSPVGRIAGFLLLALVGGTAAPFLLRSQPKTDGELKTMEEQLPASYISLANPLTNNSEAARQGSSLFIDNCSTCHGEGANGRGPASQGLNPLPANFSGSDLLDRHSDAYLFYRITEGKIGTAMPSFHGSLTPEERWQIVCYLRTLRRHSS